MIMSTKNAPPGFQKIETSIAGFWKPDKPGQSVQGIVGEAVTVKGKDGNNVFYTLTLTPDADGEAHGGPIATAEDKPVKGAVGMMIGVGGKMLLIFLRGREGREVYITYTGLGKKKPGQSAPKMFDTYEKVGE
jgi:hypothetical protein